MKQTSIKVNGRKELEPLPEQQPIDEDESEY